MLKWCFLGLLVSAAASAQPELVADVTLSDRLTTITLDLPESLRSARVPANHSSGVMELEQYQPVRIEPTSDGGAWIAWPGEKVWHLTRLDNSLVANGGDCALPGRSVKAIQATSDGVLVASVKGNQFEIAKLIAKEGKCQVVVSNYTQTMATEWHPAALAIEKDTVYLLAGAHRAGHDVSTLWAFNLDGLGSKSDHDPNLSFLFNLVALPSGDGNPTFVASIGPFPLSGIVLYRAGTAPLPLISAFRSEFGVSSQRLADAKWVGNKLFIGHSDVAKPSLAKLTRYDGKTSEVTTHSLDSAGKSQQKLHLAPYRDGSLVCAWEEGSSGKHLVGRYNQAGERLGVLENLPIRLEANSHFRNLPNGDILWAARAGDKIKVYRIR